MTPSTIDDIIKLAPIVEPLLVEAAKGLISLFERLFPPKSGPAKQAAVIQATQTVAQQTGVAVPTDQQIQGIIAAELPGILEKMANPPQVVPLAAAKQMALDATAGMIPAADHAAVVDGLKEQLANSVPVETAKTMAVDAQTLAAEQHAAKIADLEAQLAAAKAAPVPVAEPSKTHGVTFLGGTPTLNPR